MNFIKFLLIQQIIFFKIALVAVFAHQTIPSQDSHAKPLVYPIASLPNSFYETHTSFTPLGQNLLLIKGDKKTYIFDGFNWDTICLGTSYRIVNGNDNEVFILYENSVTLLQPQTDGSIHKQQLVDTLLAKTTGNINSFFSTGNSSYLFTTDKGLWLLNNDLTHIDSTERKTKLLNTRAGILYLKNGEGAFTINLEESTLKAIENTTSISINNTIAAEYINNQLVFISSHAPWIHYTTSQTQNQLKFFNSSNFNKNIRIKKAIAKHGYLLLLTEPEGYILLDENGDVVLKFNGSISEAEIDNIYDIIALKDGEVLLLTKTSILHCTNPKFSGNFSQIKGFSPTPNNIALINNKIYALTNSGLYISAYSKSNIDKGEFKKIKTIHSTDAQILHNNRVVVLKEGRKAYSINNQNISNINIPHEITNGQLFSISQLNNEIWAFGLSKTTINGFCITNTHKNTISIPIPEGSNSISGMYFYNSHILLKDSKGGYFAHEVSNPENGWYPTELSKLFLNQLFAIDSTEAPQLMPTETVEHYEEYFGKPLQNDSANLIAPLSIHEQSLIAKKQFRNFSDIYSIWLYQFSREEKCFLPQKPLASLMLNTIVYSAIYTPDSTLLLSTNMGLLYFTNPPDAIEPTAIIHKAKLISSKNEQVIKNGYFANQSQHPKIVTPSFSYRSLNASFSGIASKGWEFGLNSILFSTMLNGVDKDWTPWTKANTRDINRLSPGNYTLSVKTLNFLGKESQTASIQFTIKPNFFETPYFVAALAIFIFILAYTIHRWRVYNHAKVRFKLEKLINSRTEELVKEKEKAENLIARVLPRDTASELKEKGRVNTQRFKTVTVLFSDIEGFTRITEETNPEILIDQLDRFFLYFDSVVEKYRIEKIKTIGDAYMCAGGIPQKNRTNPVEVVLAALEMMNYMRDINNQNSFYHNVWELRIGIDTGPVIAGVVGRNKLSYDIWGSTVNIASRMESSGEPGQINISGNTFMLVKDYFVCPFRGKMPVKNRGDIEMYFVNGIKPELSVNKLGIEPNHKFKVQVQIIRLGDLEEFVYEKLEKGLPKNLYYHNLKHTVDVYTQVELIGRAENVDDEEILLLRTAALFHDSGHLIDYDTHEEMAVKLAKEILPEYQYTDKQIDAISDLIMSTKLPPQPKNLLEEIMCDADLDYLGRTDFIPVSNTLYKELHEHGKIGTLREWNEMQIKFIGQHSYFTKTARKLRNVNKQSQLDKLRDWLEKN